MPDKPSKVYVVHGRGAQRDYADAVVIAASPVTRAVMSACEGLKVVVRCSRRRRPSTRR